MAIGERGVIDGPEASQLTAAVQRARRRVLANRVLWELGLAASIALLGPMLFLILGRGLFRWPMLAFFAAAGLGVAVCRLWRLQPAAYTVCQVLDSRLACQDQISTAIYFLNSKDVAAVEQRR